MGVDDTPSPPPRPVKSAAPTKLPAKKTSPPGRKALPRTATADNETTGWAPRLDPQNVNEFDPEFGSWADYQTWLRDFRSDPINLRLIAANGPKFLWWAWATDKWDAEAANDDFFKSGWKIPDDIFGPGTTTGGGGGGGGRGGGGGGGGGGAPTEQDIAVGAAAIRNKARTLGIPLDDDAINSLAEVVLRDGWSADMLDDYLVNGLSQNPQNAQAGTFTAAQEKVKAAAASYLMPISDESAREWATRLVSGEMNDDGLRSMVTAMAKVKYAWAADVIDQGVTMRDFLLPSRDAVARELEMNPEAVSIMDPKWQAMMYVTNDKGETRAATDDELVRSARTRPEWANTKKAGDMASGLAMAIRDHFEGRAG